MRDLPTQACLIVAAKLSLDAQVFVIGNDPDPVGLFKSSRFATLRDGVLHVSRDFLHREFEEPVDGQHLIVRSMLRSWIEVGDHLVPGRLASNDADWEMFSYQSKTSIRTRTYTCVSRPSLESAAG